MARQLRISHVLPQWEDAKKAAERALEFARAAVKLDGNFAGFRSEYKAVNEADRDSRQTEQKAVKLRASQIIADLEGAYAHWFDVTAQRDLANTSARGTVMLPGQEEPFPGLENVPAYFLIFLEGRLAELIAVLEKMPLRDETEEWVDLGNGLAKSKEVAKTERTRKEPTPIVLYPATPEHPAQTHLHHTDIVVGNTEKELLTGALSADERRELVRNANILLGCVRTAREDANQSGAPEHLVGERMFRFIRTGKP